MARLYLSLIGEASAVSIFAALSVLFMSSAFSWPSKDIATVLSVGGMVGLVAPMALGAMSDRWGPRRVLLVSLIVESCLFVGLALNTERWLSIASVILIVGVQRGTSAVRGSLVAALFQPEDRVAVQSRLKGALYLGQGLGALISALAVWDASNTRLLRFGVILGGASCICSALLLSRLGPLGHRPSGQAPEFRVQGRGFLIGTYVFRAMALSVLGLGGQVLAVGLPLLVVKGGHYPETVIPASLVFEALLVICFQGRVGRWVTSRRHANIYSLLTLLLTFGGTLCLWAMSSADLGMRYWLLVAFVTLLTIATLTQTSAAIFYGYFQVPEEAVGRYLGFFSLARAAQLAVGPALVNYMFFESHESGPVLFSGILVAAMLGLTVVSVSSGKAPSAPV